MHTSMNGLFHRDQDESNYVIVTKVARFEMNLIRFKLSFKFIFRKHINIKNHEIKKNTLRKMS